MTCPAQVELGNNLTFSICTHDPDTGVLTDADAVPTYRIYEDGTEGAILNGNMDDGTGVSNSEFDDANTTGFYVKTIACTSGNGFENGKSYTIYIQATVDSDLGGISFGFNVTSLLTSILALLDDARTEPGDIAPPVNPDAMTKIDYLYKFLRNKIETTETRIHVYDDAGANKDHSSIISDNGTTFTRGEFGAGD